MVVYCWLDSVSDIYCHQMNNSVKFDWTRRCWQMSAFCCGFQRNRWWLYICVCIFYSLFPTFVFSFTMSCISGIWQRLDFVLPKYKMRWHIYTWMEQPSGLLSLYLVVFMFFSSSLDQFNQHIFCLSQQFSPESQIGSMKYLSLIVREGWSFDTQMVDHRVW